MQPLTELKLNAPGALLVATKELGAVAVDVGSTMISGVSTLSFRILLTEPGFRPAFKGLEKVSSRLCKRS